MSSNKKRRIEKGFEVELKKAPSSYGQMKKKCAVQKEEMKKLEVVIEQLRRDMTDALKRNEELVVVVRDVLSVSKEQLAAVMESVMCDYDPEGVITTATSSYQAGKTKQIMLEANNTYLKSVIVKERHELQELKKANEQLQDGSIACRRVMQELRENITILSNANDAQTLKLELFEQIQDDVAVTRESERIIDYNITRVV